jgi:hypothetical protein
MTIHRGPPEAALEQYSSVSSRITEGEASANWGTFIEDTFAEAFTMRAARIIITAHSLTWARHAATKLTDSPPR